MHRFTTRTGIEFIKKFEGFMPTKYLCAGNHWTIGYGHKLSANDKYNEISENMAEELLQKDLFIAERGVLQYINIPLENNQFDALVSFTFNVGLAALQRSSLRQKVNYQLYEEATQEFLKWIHVGTKRINGLVLRRNAESRLFAS